MLVVNEAAVFQARSGRDVGEFLRIEAQPVLRALDQIQQEHGYAAEQEHRGAVFGPMHFVVFAHAAEPVDQAFDGPQSEIEEGLVSLEDARHENAERLGDRKDHQQEEKNLEPTVGGHG